MSVFAKISIKKSACHSYMELLLTGLTGVRLSPIASFPHPPDQIQPATVRCVCVWGGGVARKGVGMFMCKKQSVDCIGLREGEGV